MITKILRLNWGTSLCLSRKNEGFLMSLWSCSCKSRWKELLFIGFCWSTVMIQARTLHRKSLIKILSKICAFFECFVQFSLLAFKSQKLWLFCWFLYSLKLFRFLAYQRQCEKDFQLWLKDPRAVNRPQILFKNFIWEFQGLQSRPKF